MPGPANRPPTSHQRRRSRTQQQLPRQPLNDNQQHRQHSSGEIKDSLAFVEEDSQEESVNTGNFLPYCTKRTPNLASKMSSSLPHRSKAASVRERGSSGGRGAAGRGRHAPQQEPLEQAIQRQGGPRNSSRRSSGGGGRFPPPGERDVHRTANRRSNGRQQQPQPQATPSLRELLSQSKAERMANSLAEKEKKRKMQEEAQRKMEERRKAERLEEEKKAAVRMEDGAQPIPRKRRAFGTAGTVLKKSSQMPSMRRKETEVVDLCANSDSDTAPNDDDDVTHVDVNDEIERQDAIEKKQGSGKRRRVEDDEEVVVTGHKAPEGAELISVAVACEEPPEEDLRKPAAKRPATNGSMHPTELSTSTTTGTINLKKHNQRKKPVPTKVVPGGKSDSAVLSRRKKAAADVDEFIPKDSSRLMQGVMLPAPARAVTRSSSRQQKRNEVIVEIDSDDDDDDDSPCRMAADASYDVARIALGRKVFVSECKLVLSLRSSTIRLEYIGAGKKGRTTRRQSKKSTSVTTHKIHIADLHGAKYFLADENEEDGEGTGPISFLSLEVEPTDENGLQMPGVYEFQGTDPDKKYVVIEFRSNDCLGELMSKCKDADILVGEFELLQSAESKTYASTLFKYSAHEHKSRQKEATSREFLRGKDTEDVLLVYPFAGNKAEIDSAANGLTELCGKLKPDGEVRQSSVATEPGVEAEDKGGSNGEKRRGYFVTVRVYDYNRLEPEEFLNDTLIDLWIRWMSRHTDDGQVHFFTSHFYTQLEENGVEYVKKWTANRNIDIFKKKFLFIPINKMLHWSLLVVVNPGYVLAHSKHVKSQQPELGDSPFPCLLFFDSLKAHKKDRVAKNVRKWISYEWTRLEKSSEEDANQIHWPATLKVYDPKIPYQDNSWDCGVFVCRYAFALYQLRRRTFSYREIFDQGVNLSSKRASTSAFRSLVTNSEEFDFGMDDIYRIREEMRTLIEKLSVVHQKFKAEEKAAKRAAKKAAREAQDQNDETLKMATTEEQPSIGKSLNLWTAGAKPDNYAGDGAASDPGDAAPHDQETIPGGPPSSVHDGALASVRESESKATAAADAAAQDAGGPGAGGTNVDHKAVSDEDVVVLPTSDEAAQAGGMPNVATRSKEHSSGSVGADDQSPKNSLSTRTRLKVNCSGGDAVSGGSERQLLTGATRRSDAGSSQFAANNRGTPRVPQVASAPRGECLSDSSAHIDAVTTAVSQCNLAASDSDMIATLGEDANHENALR